MIEYDCSTQKMTSVQFCSRVVHASDSFLSRLGSLMTEIPARLGDFGLWNLVSSSLMAAMMGAVSPSVDPCGIRVDIYNRIAFDKQSIVMNLFQLISCLCLPLLLLPVHAWVRDLWRLGYPDLLLGAGALRPTALLLLLLQLRIDRVSICYIL